MKNWYVIHTQTGQEEKVKAAIENRLKETSLGDRIFTIMIPTEKVSEVRSGQKKISMRKFYPGYVLVEMDLDDESWYFIRNTPGVTGFVGPGRKPMPLDASEVKRIQQQAEDRKEKPKPKVEFEIGESVRVKEGPFTNFTGVIEEANPNKGKLRVMVSIFGRATPVELEYWQVERI